MDFQAFEFSVTEGVAHVRLNQPKAGNPFNATFCAEYNELSILCGKDESIGAVFIDAAGKNFSVGGDLKMFLDAPEKLPERFARMTADLHMGVARFARGNAPVVVATHNLVVGGALAMIAGADFVYATPSTQFYPAFAAIGLCGDTGASYFLPRRVGTRKAAELLMLNQMWNAETALENQLINGILEEEQLHDHCMKIASKLAKGPTEVFGRMRNLLLSSYSQPLETQLEMEARGMVECAKSEDAIRAMTAIMNKK